MAVWAVSCVPMYSGSASSLIAVLNCAESATIAKPQMRAMSVTATGCPWKKIPTVRAHVPLTIMLRMVVRVRPHRSASRPASTLPIPPTAITAKAATAAARAPRRAVA